MDYFSIIDNILKKNINNYLYVENLYENFVKQEEKSKKIKKNQDIYSEYISEYIFLLHITTYHNSDYDIKIIKGTNNIVYIGLFEFDYEEVDSSNDEVEEQTENISYERTEDESIETNNSEYISSDEDENSETEDENINDFHDLKTRNVSDKNYVDVHLVFDCIITLMAAHKISDKIEDKIRTLDTSKNWIINIHMDPYDDSEINNQENSIIKPK